jgi:peptidoglycan/LPS O-acetylase OafA/YrhL
MANIPYRKDINGLRAYAVIAVILFHFGVTGFAGGFVGVDIFFVISGFLMTAILLGSLENNKFSVLNFYFSRARRLIPALIVLCAILMIVGYFVLAPYEYKAHAKNTIGALSFVSNIMFWQENGYFDASAHEKLLLHTWSLSVEWQFYMLLPVAMLLIWKLRPNRDLMLVFFILGFLISLGLAIFVTPLKPTLAFYLLPIRAWEMFAGGLVFLLSSRFSLSTAPQKLIELSGFILIFASIIIFDSSSIWPGWRALVPVIGTVLILIAARQDSILTNNNICQWVGSSSYSLYLWHWPFSVLITLFSLNGNFLVVVFALLMTVLSGYLSWRYVEKNASKMLGKMTLNPMLAVSAISISIVLLPQFWVYQRNGLPERFSKDIQGIFAQASSETGRKDCSLISLVNCSIEFNAANKTIKPNNLGLIVIGDSHSSGVISAIERLKPSNGLQVLFAHSDGCPTILKIKHISDVENQCGNLIESTLRESRSLPSEITLIIINRTSYYFYGWNESMNNPRPPYYINKPYNSRSKEYIEEIKQGMIDTACEFAKLRPVYMVRPIPELKLHVPSVMGRALIVGEPRRVSVDLNEYYDRNQLAWQVQDIAAKKCGVKILDPLPYLCSNGKCWGDENGMPFYKDDDHLSVLGRQRLSPMFKQVFEN